MYKVVIQNNLFEDYPCEKVIDDYNFRDPLRSNGHGQSFCNQSVLDFESFETHVTGLIIIHCDIASSLRNLYALSCFNSSKHYSKLVTA